MTANIPAPNTKKAFIWNMFGSGLNAFATMLLTIIAARFVDKDACGILSFAFGVAFIMQPFASLEARAYQSTDIQEKYTYHQYIGLRFLSSAAMILITGGYALVMQFPANTASIVFAVCMFKLFDAVSDVFQGMFQQHEHLEYGGKALFLRILVVCIGYTTALAITKDTVIAAWMMPACSLLVVLLYDIPMASRFEKLGMDLNFKVLRQLFLAVLPLFLSSFMNMYIMNATRLSLFSYWTQLQDYWTPFITIAAVVNLFSIFAFRPMLTKMADRWNNNDLKSFSKIVGKLLLWDVGIAFVCVLGAASLGIPVLEALYGFPLREYFFVMMIVMVAGGFNAIATLLCYLFTIMRHQLHLLIGDGITFLLTLIFTPILVRYYKLDGAAFAYLMSMTVRAALLSIISFIIYKNQKKRIAAEANSTTIA